MLLGGCLTAFCLVRLSSQKSLFTLPGHTGYTLFTLHAFSYMGFYVSCGSSAFCLVQRQSASHSKLIIRYAFIIFCDHKISYDA